jgi:6-phospho 3-hexuloisomerase
MTDEIWRKTIRHIANNIEKSADQVDSDSVDSFLKAIVAANRVFIYGAGRSGLAARAFAMRLVHLELSTFVIGETITPSTRENDFFICISGSGETSSVIDYARSAKKVGCAVACITSYPESTLAKLADLVIQVKGKTKKDIREGDYEARQIEGEHSTLTPMGTLFEDVSMVFFDGMIAELMSRLDMSESSMMKKHSSVE